LIGLKEDNNQRYTDKLIVTYSGQPIEVRLKTNKIIVYIYKDKLLCKNDNQNRCSYQFFKLAVNRKQKLARCTC